MLQHIGQSLGGMAAAVETGTFLDRRNLAPEIWNTMSGAGIGGRRKQSDDAVLAGQIAGGVEIFDADIVEINTPMHARMDFRSLADKVPWLPGALGYGEADAFPGGRGNNMIFFQEFVTFGDNVSQLVQDMLWTPETSGGLLVAVSPEMVETYIAGCETAVVIGEVIEGNGHIYVLQN